MNYLKLFEDFEEKLFEEIVIPLTINLSTNNLQQLNYLSSSNYYTNENSFGEYNYQQLINTGSFSQSIENSIISDLNNTPLNKLKPWCKKFKGTIENINNNFIIRGNYTQLNENTIIILFRY